MGKLITRFILALTIFFAGLISVCAAPVIKITGLEFDNSDNIVIVKSLGKIFPKTMETPEDNDNNARAAQNVITRGYLSNPDRVFVDITNAVLTDGAKTYNMKNSSLESVKISQFSTNPHTVRIVFTYNKKFNPNDFSVWANDRQIMFRYTKELVGSTNFKTIYNNMTKGEHRADVFESTSYTLERRAVIQNVSDGNADSVLETRDTALKSYFFLDSVDLLKNGVMVKGEGLLSLKSSFTLDNPTRVVIDIENANVSQNLRNKSFSIPSSDTLVVNGVVIERELLRIGQNDSNIARLVIQGQNAKDYRLVLSPDMQGLYIAKRSEILNSKLTQTTSRVLSYSAKNAGENLDVVNITFSNPITLSMFEENSKFYIDLQNVADFNPEALAAVTTNSDYKGIAAQKIASEKSRLIFPLTESTAVNAQISAEGKELRIYFKRRVKPAAPPKIEPIVVKPPQSAKDDKITERPSTIKQMYSVVIDPGHGGSDVGATRDGIYEKDITLQVSKIVEANLSKQGVYTYMTRDRDKTVELSERSDFSNSLNPDVFVSIHVNSSARDDITGLETHWWKDDSVDYAKKVHAKFASAKNLSKWETKNRGLFKSKFYVINHTNAPAILIEIGFISNPYERKLLMSQKRQEEIAKSITDGIMEYLKSRK